jgi:hypothetical protein
MHLNRVDSDTGRMARVPQCLLCKREVAAITDLTDDLRCPSCAADRDEHLTRMAERPKPPSSGLGAYTPDRRSPEYDEWRQKAFSNTPGPWK